MFNSTEFIMHNGVPRAVNWRRAKRVFKRLVRQQPTYNASDFKAMFRRDKRQYPTVCRFYNWI